MNKQQQLTYDKGISNIPSDILCDDNCLEESMNIVYRDGEHQPIQNPVRVLGVEMHENVGIKKVLFIHKTNTQHNYITLLGDNRLAWGVASGSGEYEGKGLLDIQVTDTDGLQVDAIGNILIVNADNTTSYLPWNGTAYSAPVTKIPIPKVKFQLQEVQRVRAWNENSEVMADADGNNFEGITWLENQGDVRNILYGMYYKNRAELHRAKAFCSPFAVRYALEMYDGSLIYQSNPIMMFPSYTYNSVIYWDLGGHAWYMWTQGWKLAACIEQGLDDSWKDIVKGIVVYVSKEAELYSFNDSWTPKAKRINADNFVFYDHIIDKYGWNENYDQIRRYDAWGAPVEPPVYHAFYDILKPHSDTVKEVAENGVYFKLCELPLYNSKYVGKCELLDELFESSRLEALEGSLRMTNDDFHSYAMTSADFISTYNNRLLLAGLKRSLYRGFSHFTSHHDDNNPKQVAFVTYLKINGMEVRLKNLANSSSEIYGIWYYYPDTRAYRTEVWEFNSQLNKWCRADVAELKQHPALNGAYAFCTDDWVLGDVTGGGRAGVYQEMTVEEMNAIPETFLETLPSEFSLSEVNNPFVFNASGYNRIGSGDIIGLSNLTTALSQGQFGQYPVILFSTEGIWAASLNSEGVFEAVHPMSREVCNNPASITQTDGAVFFSSAKGLMLIVGSNVSCVSEQLSGEFPNMLKTAKIAYDYRDSLLWIMADANHDGVLGEKCWIYNIKTGTFHKSSYFVGANGVTATTRYFNGFFDAPTPGRRVLPRYPEPVPETSVIHGQYNKAGLQAMVLDSLGAAIRGDTISPFSWYQIVDDSIIYGYISDGDGVRSDLDNFFRYVLLYFAYPDGNGHFVTRLYTKFEGSDDYRDNGEPRTDVLYYNSNFRFRWNETRDGFDKVREFAGILAESPAEPTGEVEDGMLLGEEDGNDFDMIVPDGYSYNYGVRTIVFDPVRKRFILRWVQNYTKVDDSTTRDFTLYFKGSTLLNDYVDSTNNYHPKTDSVYQDVTDNTNYPLYRWDGSSFAHIDDTDVTQLYRISGTMEITLDDAYIIQHEEQGQTIEDLSLRRGPVIDCQEYDSAPYDEYDASRLQGHMKDVLIANLEAPDLDAYPSGVMFYREGNNVKEFVEQRSYSYSYGGRTYSGIMYYDTFQWGIGEAAPHLPSTDELYVLNGTSYYEWDGNDLVPTFAGLANIVNAYPDTLFHKLGDGLYSLTERPQPEDDTNLYSGVIETRPMKLENGLALKSIMQLRNICNMNGTVVLSMWGSNNLRSWVKLRAFRNAPWKYYRFRFEFSGMSATDHFAGTMLVTQERRTNKLR